MGAFIAAKASREFRVRAADAQTTVRSGLGGVLMGFGASIAGGCSIGNGLVMTAMMTAGLGWPCIYDSRSLDCVWLVYVRPQRKARLATAAAN